MTVAERMATVASAPPSSGAAVRAALASALEPLLAEARGRDGATLVAATIAVAPSEPVALLAAAREEAIESCIWLQPDVGFAMLAIGAAWRVGPSGASRFQEASAAWSKLTSTSLVAGEDVVRGAGPVLIGGLGFSADPAVSERWSGFETADLVLPKLLVTATPAGTWLTASAVVSASDGGRTAVDDAADEWARLLTSAAAAPPSVGPADPLRITASRPQAPEWRATVARFAGAVGRGRIDKVVLARQIDVAASEPIDVAALVDRLAASAPESTVFAVTRGERTFVGATPERLVRLEGREFRTVALAGSTRRAEDAATDTLLADELLRSDKEREEHSVVVDMLRDTLAPLADPLMIPDQPSVLKLRHVQHLSTEVEGRLREPMDVLGLASRLHPTPAVAGAPRELALELIDEEERHERGWYAGPLGWLDGSGDGEFVVALRSGMVEGERATLFAGCGIVADSDPDREWDESLIKLRALGSALGRIEA